MMLGLRSIVTTKEKWYRLLFYDFDSKFDRSFVNYVYSVLKSSYLVYSTKHGHHSIGLTPLKTTDWAWGLSLLEDEFHSYYSGDTIRLSRKKDEEQKLIEINTSYGLAIPNLYNIYAGRFGLNKMPVDMKNLKHSLVFERYRTFND